jgi:hypothetical protein
MEKDFLGKRKWGKTWSEIRKGLAGNSQMEKL